MVGLIVRFGVIVEEVGGIFEVTFDSLDKRRRRSFFALMVALMVALMAGLMAGRCC